jgi:hypothetical protein
MEENLELGEVFIHRAVISRIGVTDLSHELERHAVVIQGDLSSEAMKAIGAVAEDGRIRTTHYNSNDEEYWIITNSLRFATVVILPESIDSCKTVLSLLGA